MAGDEAGKLEGFSRPHDLKAKLDVHAILTFFLHQFTDA